MKDLKIIVGTHPFGEESRKLLEGQNVIYNPFERKITETAMMDFLAKENPDAIIAGIELYNKKVLDLCPSLKLIARVGIGLDSVDLDECKKRGIAVTYTPDAPSNAVAELTIGQMINMLRRIQNTDAGVRAGEWNRYIGKDLTECSVGIVGYGRIGKLVANKLKGFNPREIYINDIDANQLKDVEPGKISSLDGILQKCDIVTLHIPLNKANKDFISYRELDKMKKEAILMNLSRGGIVEESALYKWLLSNPNASAALDSFVEEPYRGGLKDLTNCYITPHIGSCTVKSRYDMETGATKEVLNLIMGQEFNSRVI